MTYKQFINDTALTAEDVDTYLMNQAVMTFDNSSARAASLSTPTEGMVSYLKDTDTVEIYNGTAWVVHTFATRPSANLMRQAGDFTVPSSGYVYSLPWQSSNNGYINGFTVINQRITVPRTGRYRYSGYQRIQHPASTMYTYILNVNVNAGNSVSAGTLAEARYMTALSYTSSANYTINWGRDILLTSGDYLECFLTATTGAILAGGSKASDFSIEYLGA